MFPKRVDKNQKKIVSFFRDNGASVLVLSAVGHGCPDICVGYGGHNILIEIKNGDFPKSQQKLTQNEQKWHDDWQGYACVINSVEEAGDLLLAADLVLVEPTNEKLL